MRSIYLPERWHQTRLFPYYGFIFRLKVNIELESFIQSCYCTKQVLFLFFICWASSLFKLSRLLWMRLLLFWFSTKDLCVEFLRNDLPVSLWSHFKQRFWSFIDLYPDISGQLEFCSGLFNSRYREYISCSLRYFSLIANMASSSSLSRLLIISSSSPIDLSS